MHEIKEIRIFKLSVTLKQVFKANERRSIRLNDLIFEVDHGAIKLTRKTCYFSCSSISTLARLLLLHHVQIDYFLSSLQDFQL